MRCRPWCCALLLVVATICRAHFEALPPSERDGEALIERLRTELDSGQWHAAMQTRRAILALDPPAGVVRLIDSWLHALVPKPTSDEGKAPADDRLFATLPDRASGFQGSVRLSAGFDTNPYAGPSASQIRISGALGEQIVTLAPSSKPQPGAFAGLRADVTRPLQTASSENAWAWQAGIQAHKLGDPPAGVAGYDGFAYGGLTGRASDLRCSADKGCGFSAVLGAGQLREVPYEFVNLRVISHDVGGRWAVLAGGLRLQNQFASHRLGVEWVPGHLGVLASSLMVEAALTRDWAAANRAGGDQWRLRLGGRWAQGANLAFHGLCEYLRDDLALSPELFGSLRRYQLLCEANLHWRLVREGDWHLTWVANLRTTQSNAALFRSSGARLELILERSMASLHRSRL